MLSLFSQHYIGIVLITLVTDQAIALLQGWSMLSDVLNRLIRIVIDSSCHAAIACLMWSAILLDEPLALCFSRTSPFCNRIVHHFRKHRREFLCAALLGSAIDLDHFIAARSLKLFDAVHLASRPFGHSLLFALFITLICPYLLYSSKVDRLECGSFIASTYLGHLLRDSSRRGILLWVRNSSAALPTPLVLALYALLMIGLKAFVHKLPEDKFIVDRSQIRDKVELV